MTEISTGQRAFDGIPFDDYLVAKIIDGSRPKCLGPDCYIKLATKCMDKEFNKRPTATEIIEIITRCWDNEYPLPNTETVGVFEILWDKMSCPGTGRSEQV
ncbi:hypothetical protein C2G38_2030397 [Gigaspora rosea]|uniref:Serine-threonine/tyrosine-protein kinase catalytic domain-containing protein n=1 Tax=Gigaspora rosea TaxID=44941 RepID=A0A397VUF6_9GLOM|nr:hypothetical protein C2G38_2030397 [Gigaspora rosea]